MTLSKAHRTYFNIAKEASYLSDFPKIKIGAIAVYGHRVVSSGYNSCKTNPLQKKYNRQRFTKDTTHMTHAELMCLKPLLWRNDIDFKHVSLYIYREDQNNELALSRPCPSCLKLISELGIRHIYFTNHGGYSHEEILA